MNEKIITITIAFIILLIGIIAAFITPENINLKKFHTSISIIFILIIILGIPVHFQRLLDKSSYNFITWLHFLIFSYLLYISILAFRALRILNAVFMQKNRCIALLIKEFLNSK